MIVIGNNQTLMALYTVPAGKTAYLIKWIASVPKGDDVEFTFWVRPYGTVFQLKDHQHIYQTSTPRTFTPYMKINEKNDIVMRGHIGAAGGEISAAFDLILVDN